MSLWTLLLIAVGLSADAFAVAVGKGLSMPRLTGRGAVLLAVAFGVAQGVMPALGWLLGSGLQDWVSSVDHWVAFALLAGVGGKMLREAVRGDDEPDEPAAGAPEQAQDGTAVTTRVRPQAPRQRTQVPVRELAALAVATSIDALAVGIGFAFLDVDIALAGVLIGVVTFALSLVGVRVGRAAGARWRAPAEVVGGLVLIGIGVDILLEHLHVL